MHVCLLKLLFFNVVQIFTYSFDEFLFSELHCLISLVSWRSWSTENSLFLIPLNSSPKELIVAEHCLTISRVEYLLEIVEPIFRPVNDPIDWAKPMRFFRLQIAWNEVPMRRLPPDTIPKEAAEPRNVAYYFFYFFIADNCFL